MPRSVPIAPTRYHHRCERPGHAPGAQHNAFTEITGYPITQILGRNCRFLQGAETDPTAVTQLSRALHNGRDTSVVMRNYRSDGTPLWNEVSVSPVRNRTNQITHDIGTQIDVTERIDRQNTAASAE